ncbi:MAG: cell division protein FtsL [Myxococcota bacterium]
MAATMRQELVSVALETPQEPALLRAFLSLKRGTRLVLFFVALFAVALFYVWGHSKTVTATYALSNLKKKERELISQNERLRLEISTLSAPTALGKVARENLGLLPPEPGQVIMVK